MKIIKSFVIFLISIFFILWISIFLFLFFYDYNIKRINKYNFVVVFGAGITKSGYPSQALKLRLDKSIQLYKNKYTDKIFISGKIHEIYVMKNYLNNNNVSDNNIYLDNFGENTYWTIYNTLVFISNNNITNRIAYISQKYHIPRIKLITQKLKITNCDFIHSDYKKVNNSHNFLILFRESFALLKEIILFPF